MNLHTFLDRILEFIRSTLPASELPGLYVRLVTSHGFVPFSSSNSSSRIYLFASQNRKSSFVTCGFSFLQVECFRLLFDYCLKVSFFVFISSSHGRRGGHQLNFFSQFSLLERRLFHVGDLLGNQMAMFFWRQAASFGAFVTSEFWGSDDPMAWGIIGGHKNGDGRHPDLRLFCVVGVDEIRRMLFAVLILRINQSMLRL